MAQSITVDITPDARPTYRRATLYFSQGDIGRDFAVILDSRFAMTIPSGATIKIQGTKPSGLGFSITGTPVNQTVALAIELAATILDKPAVAFTSTAELTDEAGRFPAELRIEKDGVILGTANFNVDIEKNPHPDNTTDGMAEQLIPTITLLVERAEAAANSIHSLSVEANTLNPGNPATATYDEQNNEITFGIPRGAMLTATDDGNGIITLTFS